MPIFRKKEKNTTNHEPQTTHKSKFNLNAEKYELFQNEKYGKYKLVSCFMFHVYVYVSLRFPFIYSLDKALILRRVL